MYNYRRDKKLHRIYTLIKKEIKPLRIILFGSKAKGYSNTHSDYDILILLKDKKNEREITRKIYFTLLKNKISEPVDIIVAEEEKYKKYKETPGLIYKSVAKEGIEIKW